MENSVAHKQNGIFVALRNIVGVLSESADMEDILRSIGDEIVAATDANGAHSFLFPEPTGNGRYYIVDRGPHSGWHVPDPPDALAMETLTTGRPIAVGDCASDPRCDALSQVRFGIASAMTFPLIHHGEVLAAGCCCFFDPHEFTQNDFDTIMAIADVGALGVAHCMIDQGRQHLAIAEERSLLAQEMHDSVCQSLAAAKLKLQLLLRTEELAPNVRRGIQEAVDLVGEGYADARDVIHSARAASVVGDDPYGKLSEYVGDFATRTGIAVDCRVDSASFERLNSDAVLQLMRIFGEAFSNVRKHAHATRVLVDSADLGNTLIFTIRDDGIGIDPKVAVSSKRGHFGLAVMGERAEKVGGSVAVEPVSPHGTLVSVSIPYYQG